METEDTLFYTAFLFCHDKQFLESHKSVNLKVFPRGPVQYLVSLAIRLSKPLSNIVVNSLVQTDTKRLRRHGTEAEAVCAIFDDLTARYYIDPSSTDTMREVCNRWLERRSMVVGVEDAQNALDQGDLQKARALLVAAQYSGEDREPPLVLTAGDLTKATDILAAGQFKTKDACPTGIEDLDQAWSGGVRGAELGLVIGPTGVGKSMVVCGMASRAFWAGRFVMYYSTELTREQISGRILLGMVEMGRDDVKGKEYPELLAMVAKRNRRTIGEQAGLDVRDGDVSIRGVLDDLEEFKRDHGMYPGLLILDDPADMAPPGKFDKSYEGYRATFTFLRMNIAKALNIPVWVSGQATRDQVEQAYSSLKRIGDAFAKAQKSHYVLGLSQTTGDVEDPEGPFLWVKVLKDSLHGSTGAVLQTRTMFGSGENGWPGLEVVASKGIHLGLRKREDEI